MLNRGDGMRVVYIDRLFLLNLAADYFLLLLTARLGGVYPRRRRLLAGGLVGAVLAVVLYFPELPPMLALPVRCMVCLLVAWTAFGGKELRQLLRLCGLFTGATLVLGGCILGLSLAMKREGMVQNGIFYSEISMPVMLISFPAVYLLSGYTLGRGRAHIRRETRELRLLLGQRSLTLRVLVDSGNLLRDPFSGDRVIVLSAQAALPLFPEGEEPIRRLSPQQLLPVLNGLCGRAFWLLPAKTVEQSAMLLLFRPDRLYLDGQEERGYVVGLTTEPMNIGGDCRGLIGV